MTFPINYENAMIHLANLSLNQDEPGYVRVRALVKLVSELSPLNERNAEVKQVLAVDETRVVLRPDPEAQARAFEQGFQAGLAEATQDVWQLRHETVLPDDEEPTEEDDEPDDDEEEPAEEDEEPP